MSLSDRRAELKAALDLVPAVNGYAYRPTSPTEGDAYPVMGQANRDDDSGQFLIPWQVAVYLPQDEQAASQWIEANAWVIVDALESSGAAYVDSFAPVNFGTDTNFVYGLLITTRSE